jgi:PBP1b-binding outer membrane lipoprotein LpoB
MKRFVALLLLVNLLAACTASDQAAPQNIQLAEDQTLDSQENENREKSPGNCSVTSEKNFSQIVTNQLDAFANNDFEAAYQLTSTRFKNGFSLERFTNVISEYYPSLLNNTEFIAKECLEMGFTGFYEVEVKSLSGDIDLRYRFEYVGDTWFIAGAELIPEDKTKVPA